MPTMTQADIEAFTLLTGRHPHWIDVHDTCGVDCTKSPAYKGLVGNWDGEQRLKVAPARKPGEQGTLRDCEVTSSDGVRVYHVVERDDTVNGGTYWFCPCQGWATSRGRGKDCRHVAVARVRAEKGEL